jgi:hypothetical protein
LNRRLEVAQTTQQHVRGVTTKPGVFDAILTKQILRRRSGIGAALSAATLAITEAGEASTLLHISPAVATTCLCPEIDTLGNLVTGMIF